MDIIKFVFHCLPSDTREAKIRPAIQCPYTPWHGFVLALQARHGRIQSKPLSMCNLTVEPRALLGLNSEMNHLKRRVWTTDQCKCQQTGNRWPAAVPSSGDISIDICCGDLIGADHNICVNVRHVAVCLRRYWRSTTFEWRIVDVDGRQRYKL